MFMTLYFHINIPTHQTVVCKPCFIFGTVFWREWTLDSTSNFGRQLYALMVRAIRCHRFFGDRTCLSRPFRTRNYEWRLENNNDGFEEIPIATVQSLMFSLPNGEETSDRKRVSLFNQSSNQRLVKSVVRWSLVTSFARLQSRHICMFLAENILNSTKQKPRNNNIPVKR